MTDPSAPVPDDLAGPPRVLAEFALGSVLTPVLLVDGGGYIEAASAAALADLDRPPEAVRGQRVETVLGIDVATELAVADDRPDRAGGRLRQTTSSAGAFRWRAVPLDHMRRDGGWLLEFDRIDGDDTDRTLDRRVERLDGLLGDLTERFESLDRYVGLISHDLQAPARRLLSFVELLRTDLGDPSAPLSPDDIGTSLDAIERGAHHLLRLTSELLRYSRLGSQPMPLEIVDAQQVFDAVLEQLDREVAERHATVRVTGVLPPVVASPTFLGVVFQHLLQNGLEFCGDDPPEIVVSPSVSDDGVRIDIRDNGIGIAPERWASVFEPFRRLGPNDGEHSGLGLATVRDIVERFGGSISVTAGAPGGGATFSVVFRPPGEHDAG